MRSGKGCLGGLSPIETYVASLDYLNEKETLEEVKKNIGGRIHLYARAVVATGL
jgi:hypothetical protein